MYGVVFIMFKKNRKIILLIALCFILSFLVVAYFSDMDFKNVLRGDFFKRIKNVSDKKDATEKSRVKKLDLKLVKNSYHEFVLTKEGANLYRKDNNEYIVDSVIHGSVELALDSSYEIVDKYYKIKDLDVYVPYDMVQSIERLSLLSGEYKYYKNYILFNENVNLKEKAKLYVDNDNYFEVSGGSYPIIVKDEERYGIEYLNRLVYVYKEDIIEIVPHENTNSSFAKTIGVLNYHYTVSSNNENGELDECQAEICITDTMFDKHISYLKDNHFYAASLRDLELFIDGKIQLPEHTTVITIDDGWYVSRSITILEKYQMLGTLFLIGSLASPEAYRSDYLEIHSHTWDMHTIGQCPSSIGRGGILCLDENTVLEDLRKSRESLNQTTYFCYPFYDYNNRAIELLKRAGFTMALAGSERKVKVGQDKFKVPRYVIVNYTTMNEFISYVS